jgi:flagellar biosynthesis anti-sigma factor FlgM
VKVTNKTNLSLLKGGAKKSERPSSDPSRGAISSKVTTATSNSIVRHSGLDRIVRLIRDSAEDVADPRLEEIKLAIEEGRYKISSDDIAQAMIKETITFSGIEK